MPIQVWFRFLSRAKLSMPISKTIRNCDRGQRNRDPTKAKLSFQQLFYYAMPTVSQYRIEGAVEKVFELASAHVEIRPECFSIETKYAKMAVSLCSTWQL